MQKDEKPGMQEDIQTGLIALCDGMDTCFAFIGHYQTTRISYISQSIETILGYPREYFLRAGVDALRSIVHPDDMTGIVLILSQFMKEWYTNAATGNCDKNPKVASYHFRAQHNEGHWIPMDQKVFVLTQIENDLPDLVFSILSTSSTYIEEALTDNSLDGTREKLLNYLEYARLRSNHQLTAQHNIPSNGAEGVIEITTHLNPVRDISLREKEVLKLISDGYATKEIADKLCISFHTVESHRKNLLEKFGAKNSAELVKAASKYYWLE